MSELLEELWAIYKKHIDIEDTQVFPLAGRVLEPDQVEAIGREMAERRGVDLTKYPRILQAQ